MLRNIYTHRTAPLPTVKNDPVRDVNSVKAEKPGNAPRHGELQGRSHSVS